MMRKLLTEEYNLGLDAKEGEVAKDTQDGEEGEKKAEEEIKEN